MRFPIALVHEDVSKIRKGKSRDLRVERLDREDKYLPGLERPSRLKILQFEEYSAINRQKQGLVRSNHDDLKRRGNNNGLDSPSSSPGQHS